MPRNPKYPLEKLLEHRERRVEARSSSLGEAVRARASADAAQERATVAKDEEERRAARIREDESARLSRGELRALDLARQAAWERGEAEVLAALGIAEARAAAGAASARADEAEARAALGREKADREVIVKDAARFAAHVRRIEDGREEEAADEAFAGGRRSK
jgi:hypothetical protein